MIAALWRLRGVFAALGAAAILATLWWRMSAAQEARARAEEELAAMHRAHATTLETVAQLQADHALALSAALAEEQRRQSAEARYTRIKEEISNAPTDGCVGPRVRAALDGLRHP